ncbi:TonB-dependent receptor domain-containing protein [Halomonas denitrificans]|nr:TonB-dependent receptor [Halomonas denitrificans]
MMPIRRSLRTDLPRWLASLALVLLAVSATAQEPPPAQVSVLVFEQGRPAADLNLRLGETAGRSDENGAWAVQAAPGRARLTVFDGATALTALPLNLRAGELLQVIITLRGESRRAFVSLESSMPLDADALPRPAAPAEATGEGVLVGRVVSTEDGAPVGDARLFVSGTPVEARTDADGRFRIELPVGEYSVSVLHSEFATRTIEGVAIVDRTETERNFELPPAGLELAEFVVVEPFIEGSLSSVIEEQRQTASVANVLGAEQISRAGDSSVGGALSRVTGLTLVDGQFIYIRGLGERYSSTLVNGANVPSPDPTRKVVPLDLFPTGVIRSILVQKGYSPDMPGDFGGGVVEIRTRGVPDEDFFSIELSGGVREGTTFEDGLTYDGGGDDWAGYDDGTRAIPDAIADVIADGTKLPPIRGPFTPDGLTEEELEALGESLPNIYDVQRKDIGPDVGVSIEGGKRVEVGEDWELGATGSVLWDDSWRTRDELRQTFVPLGDGSLRPNDSYDIVRTTRTIGLSGFLTAGVSYADLHELNVTSMLLRQTEDETFEQIGFNLDEDGIVKFTSLQWEERELLTMQAEGSHVFPFLNSTRLEWDYSDSTATLDTPDARRYRYDPDPVSEFIFSRRADSNIRRYTTLDDDAIDFGADLDVPFSAGSWLSGSLSGGYRTVDKERASTIRRFTFDDVFNIPEADRRDPSLENILTPENIGPDGAQLLEITRNSDNYAATLDIEAFYGNLDITLLETLRLSGGLRVEDWEQQVRTFSLFDVGAVESESNLGAEDLLPAASATWFINENQQLRLSYAETIIRPDFKELSDSPFTDPILEREVVGNPDLVPSGVLHADLRWEFYPGQDELISVGVFYKLIDQPIELTVQPGVEQRLSFTNADEAENFGVELEARKKLGFVGDWTGARFGGRSLWERLYLSGNLSVIESEISILPENQGILTETSRPLQGQSPIIANVQLGYDDESRGIEATLLYNYVGERITEVGVLGAPDKKEQPTGVLDFVFRWRLDEHWSFKTKLGNLLDARFEIKQGPETTQRYSNGRTASVGISYDFL